MRSCTGSAMPGGRKPGPGGSPSTWRCWKRERHSIRDQREPAPASRPGAMSKAALGKAGLLHERAVLVVTGIQAAGKSTVAQLLAQQLPRSVHLRGDTFRRMIVA